MRTQHSPSQSRANDLWRHFVGMFGGEAVERKFGKEPPQEWVSEIGGLKDYELERGMRRLLRSGAANVPTLPLFTKLCRMIDDDDRPVSTAPQITGPEMSAWMIAANKHLLAYIGRQASRGIHYCSVRARTTLGAPHDKETCELTAPLVRHKNEWAQQMEGSNDSAGEQRALWDWHMAQAEEEIVGVRAKWHPT